jgi:hypothetical protein
VVCCESCLVAYLSTKKGDIPSWARVFVDFSKIYLYLGHADGVKVVQQGSGRGFSARTRGGSPAPRLSDNADTSGVEMGDVESNSMNPLATSCQQWPVQAKVTEASATATSTSDCSETDSSATLKVGECEEENHQNNNAEADADADADNTGSEEGAPLLAGGVDREDVSLWQQFARAIDRVCRVVIPAMYVGLVIFMFADVGQI